jgi:hypothetical protein
VGASGVVATAISVTLLPIALVLILAGVVLPRIEGTFTAGPQGITGTLLGMRDLDTYTVTGPAVETALVSATTAGRIGVGDPVITVTDELLPSVDEIIVERDHELPVLLGDVWDALDEKLAAGEDSGR